VELLEVNKESLYVMDEAKFRRLVDCVMKTLSGARNEAQLLAIINVLQGNKSRPHRVLFPWSPLF
jgi:hypothetical protein